MTAIETTAITETTSRVHTIDAGTCCQDCACIVANDDDSGMDEERAEEARATMAAIATDEGGHIVLGEHSESSHLFRCALCGDDVMSWEHAVIVLV